MLNPNLTIKIRISKIFEKVWKFDLSSVRDIRTERINPQLKGKLTNVLYIS